MNKILYCSLLMLVACQNSGPWYLPPPVVWTPHTLEMCENCPINPDRILDEMDWWWNINNAYTYEHVIYDSPCYGTPDNGVIRFTKADFKALSRLDAAAYTNPIQEEQVLEEETGYFTIDVVRYSATVYFHWANGKQIIRHEIGHAWGWGHTFLDEPGHTMSPNPGKAIDGLEYWE